MICVPFSNGIIICFEVFIIYITYNRIANGVYSRYVKEIKRNSNFTINDMEITSDVDFTKEIMKSEDYKLIVREISWLSEVDILFYPPIK